MFINGKAVISSAPNNFGSGLEWWSAAYGIQLFSNFVSLPSNPAPVFTGSIQKCSFYSGSVAANHFDQTLGNFSATPAGLVADAWVNSTTIEGSTVEAVFWIGGFNASSPTLMVMVEIMSLPTHGSLFAVNQTEIAKGEWLELGSMTRIPVGYRAFSMDYFNVPAITASGVPLALESENFTFRLIGIDPMDHQIVTTSDPVMQSVYVVHVNHRPLLLAPTQAIAAQDQPSGLGARPTYVVDGVKLLDTVDQNIDRVRINVWAFNGTLTLNREYLHLADFESCLDRYYSSWQCIGSGDHNRNMTFLAEPSNVELILSQLQYDAFYVDQSDEIVIQAFDGAGGQCLDPKELTSYLDEHGQSFQTVQNGCFAVQANVLVPAIARKAWNQMGHGNGSTISQVITSVIFGALLILMCFTTSWCMNRCAIMMRAKKARSARGALFSKQQPSLT